MTPTPQQTRENPEPHEAYHPVPMSVIALVCLMIGWASGYLMAARPDADPALGDQRSTLAGTAITAAAAPDGASLYATHCMACHQANGVGLPGVFPPLAGSEWVAGPEETLLQIVLHGVSGPIEVAGQTYQGEMPAFGSRLKDAEIAALVSHVRSHWGNTAAAVPASAVAMARELSAERTQPWSGGAELRAKVR